MVTLGLVPLTTAQKVRKASLTLESSVRLTTTCRVRQKCAPPSIDQSQSPLVLLPCVQVSFSLAITCKSELPGLAGKVMLAAGMMVYQFAVLKVVVGKSTSTGLAR